MFNPDDLQSLGAALGLGLLIGAVRERRKSDSDAAVVAGLRTHALAALTGAVALWIALEVFVAAVVLVGLFIGLSYRQTRDRDPGLTGEVALVLTCVLGGLAMRAPALASSLGVVTAVLLYAKQPLHRLARELMSEREVHDGLVLLASALIVLPLLPNRAMGPFAVFNPATLWTLVVLVMAISAIGHVLLRVVGARRGLALAGFFAGYVSSTAAVAGFGERLRESPALLRPAVGAAMLANLASLSLFVPILLAISPGLLTVLWPELSAAGLVLLLGGVIGVGVADESSEAPPTADTRMFRFSHALGFAVLITAVLFVSAWLNHWLGPRGAMTAATLAALAEIHSAVATVGNLFKGGMLDENQARHALVSLLAASTMAKTIVAWISGGRAYGLRVGLGLAAAVTAALMVAWLPHWLA